MGTCVGDFCSEDTGLSIDLLEPPGVSAKMKPQQSTKPVNLSVCKCCISQELSNSLYNCDRLWKLTTLFDMLNDFIGEFYTPLEHLVVDKVVPFLVGYCAMSLDDWCLTFWGQFDGIISMDQMTYHLTFDTRRRDISISVYGVWR